jgi:DNA-binding CsgD family transcriptional regulator
MRRITMEFNYEAAWKQIFGLNANRVEVLEALRCFKCDTQGLAIICRIKLKDNHMNIEDLLRGKGLLTNIELLYKEKDESMIVFIEGRSCVPKPPKDIKPPKMLMARPPDFLDVDRMKVEMIGKENEIKKLLHYTNKWGDNSFKVLGLTSIDTKEGGASLLSKLTPRQRQMLLTAYALGYYDVPRRISSDELSGHLKVDKSTLVEHLRKAERKLIGSIIAE